MKNSLSRNDYHWLYRAPRGRSGFQLPVHMIPAPGFAFVPSHARHAS